ncbi:MAG TPA: tetratricopeptide repeat protein [Pirellulaceae bacterium]|nr:tetratricopeptide repeat protein [Pirellulaceae bacterium]HMO93241.1 tetratricopeptide repeat protein [Pirellulaceae bacterium]HMP69106.1 tetratricopeptide repeat protein [Pirellulaceae bacterium]
MKTSKIQSTATELGALGLLVLLLLPSGIACNMAATGHNVHGRRLYEQGQFNQAFQSFNKAIQANPRNADAYYNMAALYHYLGRQQNNIQYLQQAEQLYGQAITFDNNHVSAYRGLAVRMLESGRGQDAFNMLRNWQARYPYSEEPLIEIASLLKDTGDRNRSMQYLVDALALNSQNARALKEMGQLREEAGQYQLALDNYIRSYQANNLQTDVAQKIASLQGQLAYSPGMPGPGQPIQPGQPRFGGANFYVPR